MADGNLILTNSDDWAGAKLDVDGNIKIRGGGPGAGKVLTSDADGLATWEDAPAGGGGGADDDWVINGYILTSGPGISQVNSAGGLGLEDDYEVTWNNTGGTTLSGRSWRLTTSVGGNIIATAFSDGRFILGQTDAVTNSSTIRLQVHGRGMAGSFGIGHGDGDPISAKLHVKGDARIEGIAQDDTLTRVLVADADGNISSRDAGTLGGGGGGGTCTPCANVETAVFESVCKIFVDDISNVAQITECVRVMAQLILVDVNISEADCMGIILSNVQDLIDAKNP